MGMAAHKIRRAVNIFFFFFVGGGGVLPFLLEPREQGVHHFRRVLLGFVDLVDFVEIAEHLFFCVLGKRGKGGWPTGF